MARGWRHWMFTAFIQLIIDIINIITSYMVPFVRWRDCAGHPVTHHFWKEEVDIVLKIVLSRHIFWSAGFALLSLKREPRPFRNNHIQLSVLTISQCSSSASSSVCESLPHFLDTRSVLQCQKCCRESVDCKVGKDTAHGVNEESWTWENEVYFNGFPLAQQCFLFPAERS